MAELKILEIQEGVGDWQVLGTFSGEKTGVVMGAPSGGGIEFVDQFARNHRLGGVLQVVDTIEGGTPAPFTYTLELPYGTAQFLSTVYGNKAIRVRWYEGEYSVPTNYLKMIVLPDSRNGNIGFTRGLVNDTTNEGDPQRRTVEQRAPTMLEIDPIQHTRVQPALSAEAFNHLISIGIPTPSTNDRGNQEIIAVSDDEGTPATPKIGYTNDGWLTAKELDCTGLINNDIMGVARAGANLILATDGSAGGLWYVPVSDVRDQASAVAPTRSSGVVSGTSVHCVIAVSAKIVYAGGDAGAVYKSVDGGLSFTTLATGGAQNVISVAAFDETLLIFGGVSGECYKLKNGTFSALTVTGISTSNINAVAIPERKRGNDIEIYLGASDGDVYRSLDEGVTWSTPAFDSSGAGAIEALVFAGFRGAVLFVVQTDGSSQSRVLRDLSGGNLGQDVEIFGSFTSPATNVINAIVAPDENTAYVAGEALSSFGYLGKVAL